MAKRLVHCWKQGPLKWVAFEQFVGTTCMLRDGHPGECEFVRDDEIQISVTEVKVEEPAEANSP